MADEPATKRAKIDEAGDGIPEATKEALKDIDAIQGDIDGLNEKASEEILKIEQKYNSLRKPFYEKRSKAIKEIPNFWLTALINHPQISAIVDENEEEALNSLTSLEVEEYDDIKSGFKIVLRFKENAFFENDVISKEYLMGGDQPTCKTSTIKWKPGKDLTQKDGDDEEDDLSMSFFEWLSNDLDPSADDVAEVIKDDIWPNPVQYYLVPEVDDDDSDEEGLEEVDDEAASDGDNA